jgi:hypothetical protein
MLLWNANFQYLDLPKLPFNFSLLRKLTTILLLTLFCNSLFYYGYFSFSLLKAKLDAKLALAKMSPQAGSNVFQTGSDILKVPVCLLQKDQSDEVWYHGKLYDVVERDRINDTIYVFLLQDEQEQNVLAANQKYFQDNCGALPDGAHEVTGIKKAPTITDTEHIPNYQLPLSRPGCLIGSSPAAGKSRLSAVCAETPSPPPRQA